jgi:hypothetical protein
MAIISRSPVYGGGCLQSRQEGICDLLTCIINIDRRYHLIYIIYDLFRRLIDESICGV